MAERIDPGELAQGVRQLAIDRGAALVGVAPAERFDPMPPLYDAVPEGHHPRDFLPEARSVISFAQPILNPVMDAPAVLATRELPMIPPHVRYPYFEALYNRVGHVVHDVMLELIAQAIGQYLMARGYDAMIFPTTGLHPRVDGLTDVEIWEDPPDVPAERRSPFRYTFGPFSHRHAATRAGLGEFGYNNLAACASTPASWAASPCGTIRPLRTTAASTGWTGRASSSTPRPGRTRRSAADGARTGPTRRSAATAPGSAPCRGCPSTCRIGCAESSSASAPSSCSPPFARREPVTERVRSALDGSGGEHLFDRRLTAGEPGSRTSALA